MAITEMSASDVSLNLGLSPAIVGSEPLLHALLVERLSIDLPRVAVKGKVFKRTAKSKTTREQGDLFGDPSEKSPPGSDSDASLSAIYDLLYPIEDFSLGRIQGFDKLFAYQKEGVKFLIERHHALLADEMGLGKTAQTSIATAVLMQQDRIGRVLILCPKSIVHQWVAESLRWGGFQAIAVTGPAAMRTRLWTATYGVFITTPHTLLNDVDRVGEFDLVIADDVSMLKNPGTITSAIRSIIRRRTWVLSGTPLENKPEDMVNVFEFVKPGLFSAVERYNAPSRETMRQRVAPYMLRRRKKDYLHELPDKITLPPQMDQLEGNQKKRYLALERRELEEFMLRGERSNAHVFAIISRLLQVCNFDSASGESKKLEMLTELIERITEDESEKIVVFSRSVETINFLSARLSRHKFVRYVGSMSDSQRKVALDTFFGDANLFLGSTKACQRGLNLQHARHVVHFDRTWNPADEMQAEDRCWRHGQTRNVLVHRFVMQGTIEERVEQVLAEKKSLFAKYVDSHSQTEVMDEDVLAQAVLTIDDLLRILKPA